MSATTSRLFQYSKCDPMLTTKILLLTRVILKSFKKKKKDSSLCLWSCFVTFCHVSLDIFCSKDKNFSSTIVSPRFGEKSEIYNSLSLFTCYSSWHCSLRNFAYLRGVVPYISSNFLVCLVQDFFPRESYPLWAFLWEISLRTITSLLSLQSL